MPVHSFYIREKNEPVLIEAARLLGKRKSDIINMLIETYLKPLVDSMIREGRGEITTNKVR